MGTIKDRNSKDLIEEDEIKKRWQEYTEEVYKKDLGDPDNHNGVVMHLEPDTLECEVKWTLGSIPTDKASRGDRIPDELFKILNDNAVKVLYSSCQQIWKTQQWVLGKGMQKVSFYCNPKERQCQRLFQLSYNYIHFTC